VLINSQSDSQNETASSFFYPLLSGRCTRRAYLVEPGEEGEDVATDALDVLLRLPEEEGVEHPIIYLDDLVLAGRGLVQGAADIGIGHLVRAAVRARRGTGW
jgi:hypothetical protein